MFFRLVFLGFLLFPFGVYSADYVATEVRVVNDRWPDPGSPESFGRDAIRLASAITQEEQAIAVWRFIQQMTEVGKVPKEPAYGDFYVVSPKKLLNVYGVQWCDGLSRIMTMTWRALGYRADKLYKFGHTLADIHYRDTDGVDRWHVFDLSQHWYVYDRTGSHIATKEELALDHSLLYYPSRTPVPDKPSPMQPSWVHAGHLNLKPHSMGISLRLGESVEFLFGNEGKPYFNLFPGGERRNFEHGPYPLTYGNGRLVSKPLWEGENRETVYSVEIPYVISDAFLAFSGEVTRPDGYFRISLSTDGGSSWKMLWQTDDENRSKFAVKHLDFCPSFDPKTTKNIDMITPFGRYDYKLKFETNGCRLDGLQLMTVFQHNLFALPMLWPGSNRLSVGGNLVPGAGLKITRLWDDNKGQNRSHEQVMGVLPSQYIIDTEGREWQDIRCRSMRVEAIELPKQGGVAEAFTYNSDAATGHPLPYLSERSIGSRSARQPDFERDAKELEGALRRRDTSEVGDKIVALGSLRDPRSAELLERVVIEDITRPAWHKILACQALYHSIGADAVPVMMRVLERDPQIVWAKPAGKWTSDAMWIHTAAAATALLVDIRDFPERERAAELVAETLNGNLTQKPLAKIYHGGEIGWGLIRALGRLGDSRHVELLTSYLADKGDAAAVATEALIDIGDPSVLQDFITLLSESQYPPARTAAIKGIGSFGERKHGKMLYSFLRHQDENFRAAAAGALGELNDPEAVEHLQAALQKESFSWVREIMRKSLRQ